MNRWQTLLVISSTIAVTSFIINYLNNYQNSTNLESKSKSFGMFKEPPRRPKYWFHHPNGTKFNYIFQTIDNVLGRLNLEKIDMNFSALHDDWDLLWSYQFHNLKELDYDWTKLKYHQKINHIPGNHRITSKSLFGTTTDLKYVPKAFTNITMLKEYAAQHPEKRFVIKSKANRGVELKKVSEMNFDDKTAYGYFAQEFIENPLLFNGYKFDFAVYVVVTSIQPLRVYYYTKNMIFRFCPKTYNVSDPKDTDRYVVSDTKIPVWEFNGTKEYFEHGYNTKDAFEGFLKSIGADVDEIWRKIEDCIRTVMIIKEKEFIKWIKSSIYNHFELFRFDMILDQNLNLFIIEINQHPNLYPGKLFKQNQYLYENLLYNLFNLIGVGTSYTKEILKIPSKEVEKMIAEEHVLNVKPQLCMSDECKESCNGNCMFCRRCLSSSDKYQQMIAYQEQMNIGDFKRLFPPEEEDYELMDYSYWDELSIESQLQAKWFEEMCERNRKFC